MELTEENKEVIKVWADICKEDSTFRTPGESCDTCAFKESCKKTREELGFK